MKIILMMLLVISACKAPTVGVNLPETTLPSSKTDGLIDPSFIDLANTHRQDLGLKAFIYSEVIERVAQEHALNMAMGMVSFGHTGSADRCRTLITELGPANLCGEVVAAGQKTIEEVYTAWMSSSTHRSKFENPRYTHTGLGMAKSSKGVAYWTQIFLEVL